MKTKFTALLSFLLLLAPLSVFAASGTSKTVTFPRDVTVAGTNVPAGTYKVQYDGSGTATILKGKQEVVKAPVTAVQSKTNYDGALTIEGNALLSIQVKNQTLQFEQTKTAGATSGN